MGAYLAISLIVSLAMSALSAGVTVNQLTLAGLNQLLRGKISDIMSVVNKEVSKSRLNINKIIALATSRNQQALMNYLQNNPVVSRSLDAMKSDSDLIASIQAEQSSIESEIATLQSELNSMGYSQSTSGTGKEEARVAEKHKALGNAVEKYKQLEKKADEIKFSTTNEVKPYTADIDARSQNINGGMK